MNDANDPESTVRIQDTNVGKSDKCEKTFVVIF